MGLAAHSAARNEKGSRNTFCTPQLELHNLPLICPLPMDSTIHDSLQIPQPSSIDEDERFSVLDWTSTDAFFPEIQPGIEVTPPEFLIHDERLPSPVGSDCSWTEEDDTGSLFFEIEQRIRSFLLNDGQTDLILSQRLTSKQRRIVHGMAHLMHVGHKSVKSDGKLLRRMHIFKKTRSVPIRRDSDEAAPGNAKEICSPFSGTTRPSICRNGTIRAFQVPESRNRLPKKEGGFPCRYSDCSHMFDRACDRKKHEKRHEPKANHPYHCSFEGCGKTFMYPKDLRRHERVHQKRGSLGSISAMEDGLSADEVFTDASVGSFSGSSSMVSCATAPTLNDPPSRRISHHGEPLSFWGGAFPDDHAFNLNDPVWSDPAMGKDVSEHEEFHSPGDLNLSDGEFFDIQMV